MSASSSQAPASSVGLPSAGSRFSVLNPRFAALLVIFVLLGLSFAARAAAQTFEVVGTRAAGMGGAFVAVADDASAVYWNPAGLATGSYFSVVLDRNVAEASDPDDPQAGSQSGTLLALGVPAIGLSYYRLRLTTVRGPVLATGDEPPPLAPAGAVRVESLITHHAGVTFVQSITDWIAVATTLKLVRGVAAAGVVPLDGDRDELLEEAGGLVGAGSNEFDADIGVLALVRNFRFGLAVRNVREADFETPGDAESLQLERQVRAGVAYTAAGGLLLSADLDLESVPGTTGLVRNFAAGAETRIFRRAAVRGGFRINTRDDQPAGRTPVGTAGVSYAVMGSILIDGQATFGSESSDRGWGVGVRVVF